jgi:predicted metal-dependent phosphoesterase TrpH
MKRIEFHCHTKYSTCSNLEPKEILRLCKNRGLDGVLICDHDTLDGYFAFKKILPKTDDFILIPGIEITTDRGDLIAAWIEEFVPTNHFPEVVESINEQDGIVIVPHPFDRRRSSAFLPNFEDSQYFDAIEVLNSRCIIGNKEALRYAQNSNLLKCAGSDAHFNFEIGRAWISFSGSTSMELKDDFKQGKTGYGGKKAPLSFFLKSGMEIMARKIKGKSP